VSVALLTTYLTDYRLPLYRLLAARHGLEVLCYGRGGRYVPAWFADLDAQLAAAEFPARRIDGLRQALDAGRDHEAVIAPFAGGAMLPAAYAAARRRRRPFILWASVWHQPQSPAHALARPLTGHIYRHADAVLAYGEHVRRFVAGIRGRDDDVFVAPQAVEPELFARAVDPGEIAALRDAARLGDGPLVVFAGRLVADKGIEVLAGAWARVAARHPAARLVVAGDGPLGERLADSGLPRVSLLGAVPRAGLAVLYAGADAVVVPSIPTPRFKEPWGLVCNEAMHQGRALIASDAVGAVAGGLVRDGVSGLVVPAGDAGALAGALERLLGDPGLRSELGAGARAAVAPYTYEAMADAFGRALRAAGVRG
jgi:glycosyltransferase involved in cell wall biosynthesis